MGIVFLCRPNDLSNITLMNRKNIFMIVGNELPFTLLAVARKYISKIVDLVVSSFDYISVGSATPQESLVFSTLILLYLLVYCLYFFDIYDIR